MKAEPMENEQIRVEKSTELNRVTNDLVQRYQPDKLICFGHTVVIENRSGCFTTEVEQRKVHYFLLMVVNGAILNGHEVQDYVNTRLAEGRITIIVHRVEEIRISIKRGKSFFNTIYKQGELLYAANGLFIPEQETTVIDRQAVLLKAEVYFRRHQEMAESFLIAAENLLERGSYATAIFLLQQATEQACIAMIRFHMGYRAEVHHIGRLLDLCACFSEGPAKYFYRSTPEEQRLFRILVDGYIPARYSKHFKVERWEADRLLQNVKGFLQLSNDLCKLLGQNNNESETKRKNQKITACRVG